MAFTAEQLEQIAGLLSGTSIGSNGKASKVKTGKNGKVTMNAISMDDLKKGNPVRERDEIPADALTCQVDGTTYAIYPAEFAGVVGVKIAGLPPKKSFFSANTLKVLANEDFQEMVSTFVESLG